MVNSVILLKGAQFAAFGIGNFYLDTPIQKLEYVHIQFFKIHQEFIDEYYLTAYVHNGWVYFEIIQGTYSLP